MHQILLWTFDRSDGALSWHMPIQQLEGAQLLDHFGLTDPDPLIQTADLRPTKLSAALASTGVGTHLSGRVVDWSGQALFSGAEVAGRVTGQEAAGAIVCRPLAEVASSLSPVADTSPAAPVAETSAAPIHPGRDVATLERAQQADPNFTRLLIEAIEALPEAFVLYGPDDRMVVCNEQYRRLYPTVADMMAPGLSFQDVMSESVRRGVFKISEDADIWARRRLSFHHANIGFFEQHLSDGRWIQVSERKTPSGATSSIRADITVLKERESDLRGALDQATSELSAQTRFVAKVGHELRNPLNVVYNIAQLLKEEQASPSLQRTFNTLFGAASAMRDVLGDFLDVTSLRAGQFRVDPQATDTRPLLLEIVDFARLMGRQSAVSFRSLTAHDIPRRVLTDPHRIRQIMFNLLGNAFKYAAGGSVMLRTTVEADDAGMPILRIAVTDTGKGIGTLGGQIFTPYTRNREHRLAGIEGLGLGLAVSEELASALGITLGVAPLDEGGTRAWIDIPIVSAHQLVQVPSRGALPHTSGSGPVLDVLVVDDEPANLIVAQSVLKRLGHRAITAPSGQQALMELRAHSFDAALLDISMPDMSGVELAHAIVAGGLASDGMGLIAMTGNVMPDDIRHYFDAGITGYIEKPVDIRSLAEVLSAIRKTQDGKFPLTPQEWVRFPRGGKGTVFDRGRLDRMVEDIGQENVAAIVSSTVMTMQATLSLIKSQRFSAEELLRSLHKVQSVAALLGFEPLSRLAQKAQAAAMDDQHLAELQDELATAIVQLQDYADEAGSASLENVPGAAESSREASL